MNTKGRLYVLVVLLGMGLLAIWLQKSDVRNENPGINDHSVTQNHNSGFDRNITSIEYTRHATCRMACRHITKSEVKDIMKNGTVNYKKSDVKDRPCPTYALEGYTREDNQHVRIIFAQCDHKIKVVTCIDLENEFSCDCN